MPSKLKTYVITAGLHKGKTCTIPPKQKKGVIVKVNIIEGPIIEIPRIFLR